MYEVEVKVRADVAEVGARLRELDAERVGAVRQIDVYYDHPSRSFAETDEALRLRRESGDGEAAGAETTLLTYKGPLVEAESKTREEFETAVDDPEALESILDGVGFDPVAEVHKERERYRLDGYAVTLDAVEGVGEFVEVETEGPAEEVERLREGAYEVLRRLDLDPDEQIRTSYLGLLLGENPGED